MGSEVYITRKERWTDDGPQVSGAEWVAAVATEPQMHVLTPEENGLMGARPGDPWPMATEWTAHSSGGTVWFNYANGQVDVVNPDVETLALMERLAARLGARLLRREF